MNHTTTHRVTSIIAAVALLAIGITGGMWWARRDSTSTMAATTTAGMHAGDRKVLYWYDPMQPDQHFGKPGKSPFMDMPLVPKYADDAAASGVRIATGMQQNVGIRTAIVETGALASVIRVPATLAWDQGNESVVGARVEGIVTRVLVKMPYTPVHRGQVLAYLLAPEWSSALAEARALDHVQSAAARELRGAAQQRLHVLGVSGHGGHGGVELTAAGSGVVSEVLVREGQAVTPGTPLFRINGTSTVWLEASIPQGVLAGIRAGTRVEATVDALPGRTFHGEVQALLPQVDPATRSLRARIILRNPDGRLAAGMFAQVVLHPEGMQEVPLVPNEALIATGTDSRVVVVGNDGVFHPVRVRSGRSSGGKTEILAGLAGGERVVTSGQFLIDSEASLSGALQRMQPAASDKPSMPAESMPGMEMHGTQEAHR